MMSPAFAMLVQIDSCSARLAIRLDYSAGPLLTVELFHTLLSKPVLSKPVFLLSNFPRRCLSYTPVPSNARRGVVRTVCLSTWCVILSVIVDERWTEQSHTVRVETYK